MKVQLFTKLLKTPILVNLDRAISVCRNGSIIECHYLPSDLFGILFGSLYVREYECKDEEHAKKVIEEYLR